MQLGDKRGEAETRRRRDFLKNNSLHLRVSASPRLSPSCITPLLEEVDVEEFLEKEGTILDVRSPSEYLQGHIPGSVNLPLFSDQERTVIGTIYKQQGEGEAISQGIEFALPKTGDFLDTIVPYLDKGPLKIHCWRGGLRSSAMATLFQSEEIPTFLLEDGYKSFRRWTRSIFSKSYDYKILSGLTGTGKTAILKALENLGEQVIDLEGLARHKGGAFGVGEHSSQPSTEQFQNELALKLSSFDLSKPIWIEDESRMIGSCHIPEELSKRMKQLPLIIIERTLHSREKILERDYGNLAIKHLITAVEKIQKKLGRARAQKAIHHLREGNLHAAGKIVLNYYDSAYRYGLTKRKQPLIRFNAVDLESYQCAEQLITLDALHSPMFSRSLDTLS